MPFPLRSHASRRTGLVLLVAIVLTVAMGLFPPFTSVGGTEYAFVLSGPAWTRAMGAVGGELGLGATLYWPLLLSQLALLWGAALGAVLIDRPQRRYGVEGWDRGAHWPTNTHKNQPH